MLFSVVVSLLKPDEEIIHTLDSFGYGFFIPIFFIMVGVDLDIPSLIKEPSLLIIIPILILSFIVSKLIPSYLFEDGLILKQPLHRFLLTSHFRLLLRKNCQELKAITSEMSGILILSAIITCVFVPVVFKNYSQFQMK